MNKSPQNIKKYIYEIIQNQINDNEPQEVKINLDRLIFEGKSQEEQKKIVEDKTAEMQLVQSEAQNKLKASLDSALNAVAKEKGLGAVLIKDAVPQGGVDVTDSVIEKMK